MSIENHSVTQFTKLRTNISQTINKINESFDEADHGYLSLPVIISRDESGTVNSLHVTSSDLLVRRTFREGSPANTAVISSTKPALAKAYFETRTAGPIPGELSEEDQERNVQELNDALRKLDAYYYFLVIMNTLE